MQTIPESTPSEDEVILAYLRDAGSPHKRRPPHRRGYVLNALAFSTLLSSQGTDAHHQQPPGRLQGNYSNLPDPILAVNISSEEPFDQPGRRTVRPRRLPMSFRSPRSSPAADPGGFPSGLGSAFRRPVPRGQEEL